MEEMEAMEEEKELGSGGCVVDAAAGRRLA